MATLRYLVNDVNQSIQFYTQSFGFELIEQYGPAMAIIKKNDLSLWLAGPLSSAAKPMSSGETPKPGGWNRFVLQVNDLKSLVIELKLKNIKFKNEILSGPGGLQILCEDPSGNVIELFEAPTES